MSDLKLEKVWMQNIKGMLRGVQFTSEMKAACLREFEVYISEEDQRVKDARRVALGDAVEAIFTMGAWHPHYENLTPNTFDEGTSAAYEIVRELQGKAESALQSEER